MKIKKGALETGPPFTNTDHGHACVLKRLVQSVLIHLRTCSGGEVGEDRHYGVQTRSRYLDSTTICLG